MRTCRCCSARCWACLPAWSASASSMTSFATDRAQPGPDAPKPSQTGVPRHGGVDKERQHLRSVCLIASWAASLPSVEALRSLSERRRHALREGGISYGNEPLLLLLSVAEHAEIVLQPGPEGAQFHDGICGHRARGQAARA